MKRIILGIFDNSIFKHKVHNEGYDAYPFDNTMDDDYDWSNYNIIQNVQNACSEADEILFLLDYIEHSIVNQGYTSMELKHILKTPSVLSKTIFKLNDINVDNEMVMGWYGVK